MGSHLRWLPRCEMNHEGCVVGDAAKGEPTDGELMVKTVQRKAVRSGGNGKTLNVIPAAFNLEATLVYLGGISAPTLHRWVDRGLLHPNRHSRYLIFSKVELDRFLSETRNWRWKRRKVA
jgi:hypothetical protein